MEPPQPASRSYRAVVFAVFFVVVGVGTWLALQLLAYYAGGGRTGRGVA